MTVTMPALAPKRILIVGPAWVGDMVMAQTLFIQIKKSYPEVQIHVLAPAWSRPLLERMPEVSQALALPLGHGQLALAQRYRLGKSLRATGYDQAFVLPNSFKSALIPWWANIPRRTGWRGEMRWGLLNDIRRLDKARYPLMIERFMALAFVPSFTLSRPYPTPYLQIDATQVAQALTKMQLTADQPILAVCPGAEFGPAKRWPEQHYASVAQYYLALGWQVWLFGSANDFNVCEAINQACEGQCVNLAGKTTLGEAVDLLSVAHAVVTNDSGLMHIAAALGRPLVAVYGSSSPTFTPPLSDRVKIVRLGLACSPCFQRQCPLTHLNCLVQLTPQMVLDALTSLLEEQTDVRI